ncbi:HTTM domain-containing protein [Pontibacter ramchanderi]|uniref:Vitamin K-dependent gamma-carboxylase-like protein n=1 Tax=Pontibacter ramchanderi TaxID=1179743 RepID=A0A2N3U9I5_9BACT|nr:HTTM domain-containing protein [Pontibacter ramchanderi]PKV63423.1 vitamin K-dependent gamma-carboxylase-like protein [Pontibacter ramchanderi]
MLQNLKARLTAPVSAAPLAVFRIIFGAMMLGSIVRFMAKGWVHELYVAPKVYFPFYGFEWVKPLGETGMYVLFALMAFSALGIMLGLFYRWSAVLFFLSFTYVELIDKTNYLNHYYFVSIVALLMILVPAHRHFSLDVLRKPQLWVSQVPRWTILIFQLQLGLVYFYAGVAKLNADWLFEAMPLRYWLPAHTHLPLIGPLLDEVWVAFVFCWFGAFYDLTIPFFLSWRKSRSLAYLTVVVFHVLTAVLFQIGMFPYIMMLSTLIFFSAGFHERILQALRGIARVRMPEKVVSAPVSRPAQGILLSVLALHFAVQVLLPWRFLLYPDKLFWTEQGYRFSWRVMLMEKAGTAFFYVRDPQTGQESEIHNLDYLTVNQEKMMATQPDMLLQFAHMLRDDYKAKGIPNPEVRAEAYVTMNGRGSRLLIDPNFNLAAARDDFRHKHWILPFEDNALQPKTVGQLD